MKSVAIIQSSYVPWKGYFDIINRVDEFILFDDVQYTRRDWRNRNRIKSRTGEKWISIPVAAKSNYHADIKDMRISDSNWCRQHWNSIVQSYSRAPYFNDYRDQLEQLYLGAQDEYLSQVNFRFLKAMMAWLGISTPLSWSMDYGLPQGTKTARLVSLCQAAGATHYVSGPSAESYMEPTLFRDAGVELSYINYEGYPEYEQLYPPFSHFVSILDLIVHCGPASAWYAFNWRNGPLE